MSALPMAGSTTLPPNPPDRQDLVERTIRRLLDRRASVASDLSLLDAQLESLYYDLCWTKNDPQDVETYDGRLGVRREFVDKYESPVGQLQWLADVSDRFSGAGDDPGNVAGQRWGTGALIADDLFLTAGHCFEQSYPSWHVPSRDGYAISPNDIAMEMCVNFKYQIDGTTGRMRFGISYPVLGLLEHSTSPADYAIVKLGKDAEGRMPGDVFGTLAVAKSDLTIRNAILCVIEHPNRQGKKVAAGHLMESRNGRLSYNDIGTSGGASGAPILDGKTGEIVGVHVKGGSLPIGGFNSGTAIGAIRAVTKLI